MRLIELDPKWLEREGRRVGFVFLCPHCQKCYLSCFAEPTKYIAGDEEDSQYGLFAKVLSEAETMTTVPCRRGYAWQFSPPIAEATFENLTVMPSIDCSAAGCWHGFIASGEAK